MFSRVFATQAFARQSPPSLSRQGWRLPFLFVPVLLLGACMGEPLPPSDARYALGACPPALASYVALGSSSTEGTGASDARRTSYVALLRDRLRATCPNLHALNLGRGSARVDTFLAQIPEIERAAPAIITILPFADYANTPIGDFSRDYATLIDTGPARTRAGYGNPKCAVISLCAILIRLSHIIRCIR
jgi:hypothetical protein